MTEHQELVQGISSEMTGGRQNHKIRVIDPRACAAVLSMSDAEIDAFCTLLLCREDEVLMAARQEVFQLNPYVVPFILENLPSALAGGLSVGGEDIGDSLQSAIDQEDENRLTSQEEEEDEEENDRDGDGSGDDIEESNDTDSRELHELLGELESTGFVEAKSYEDNFRIVPTVFPGLCALYFEARVRHGCNEPQAVTYMRLLVARDAYAHRR